MHHIVNYEIFAPVFSNFSNLIHRRNIKIFSSIAHTCKHIRYVRSDSFSSYHLSGILIDSFVYAAIKDWHWLRDGEQGSGKPSGSYEQVLLDYYNQFKYPTIIPPTIKAPGSGIQVGVDDWDILGKVLNMMV